MCWGSVGRGVGGLCGCNCDFCVGLGVGIFAKRCASILSFSDYEKNILFSLALCFVAVGWLVCCLVDWLVGSCVVFIKLLRSG